VSKLGRALILSLALFSLAMFVSIQVNIYYKVTRMPAEIHYQVVLNENVWPDQFFSAAYTLVEPNGFRVEGYWTFEPSHCPLSVCKWEYHPEALIMTEVYSTIREIKR